MSAALTSIKVRHPIATSWKNRLHRAGQNIFSIFLRRRTESMDGRASLQYFSPNRFNDFISLNFIFNKRYYVISMGTYFTRRAFSPRLLFSIIIRTISDKERCDVGLERELPLRKCNGTVVTEWRKWRSRASTSD